MVQQTAHSIIDELEDAVRGGTPAKRVQTLRRVTDLFLNDGDRFNEEQVEVFDQVLCLLITRVETRARAELSKRLAPVDYAPFEVIQSLARDDDISVAGAVLTHSSVLGSEELCEIAGTKGQDHLFAISERENLPEAVTDVIVDRGDGRVVRRLAKNASAKFSENGYDKIVARADGDDELVEILGMRIDLPIKLLRDLLRRAKDAVRERLLAIAPPALRNIIQTVLNAIARDSDPTPRRNYTIALELVKLMKQLNELDDAAVRKFAETGKFDEVTAALAVLNDMPVEMVERAMLGARADLLLIPTRSAGLTWTTVALILRKRPQSHQINDATLAVAERDFGRLSLETAQRTIRFWQLHNKMEKQLVSAG